MNRICHGDEIGKHRGSSPLTWIRPGNPTGRGSRLKIYSVLVQIQGGLLKRSLT